MKRRILSVLLAALMIFSSVSILAVTASAEETSKLAVEVVTSKVGDDTFYTVVNVTENPVGFAGVTMGISFDNTKVTPVSYDDTDVIFNWQANNLDSGADLDTLTEVYMSGAGAKTITETGKLIGITFQVKAGWDGNDIPLTLTIEVADKSYNDVPYVVDDAKAAISKPAIEKATFADGSFVYDGTAHTITVEGVPAEYVTYTNNVLTDVGTLNATAKIEMDGQERTLNATITVTKAPVTLAFDSVEVYVNETATVTAANVNGVVSADKDFVAATGSFTVPASDVAGEQALDVTGFALTGAKAGNYEITGTATVTVIYKDITAENIAAELPANTATPAPVDSKAGTIDDALLKNILLSDVAADLSNVTLTIVGSSNEDIITANGEILADNVKEDTVVELQVEVDVNGTKVVKTISFKVRKSGSNYYLLLLYWQNLIKENKTPVAGVTANVVAGEVEKGTKVELSTATAGATIYYTVDGTAPTALSKVYNGPIAIDADTTIKAIAIKAGLKNSDVATFAYTVKVEAVTTITLKADAATIKYMIGRGDIFAAEADATRYEVVVALNNLFDIKTTNEAIALSDVADEYKEVVELFTAAGIISGYPDGTFRGDKTITRAEFCKIVCVMLGLDVDGAADAGFADAADHWAADYINACAAKGYVNGKGEGKFAPDANIKRGEVATLINRITGAEAGTECAYADVAKDAWYFGAVAAAAK